MLTFVAKSGDRAEAQAAANAFAKAYIAASYTSAVGNLKTAVADIQTQLDRMLDASSRLSTRRSPGLSRQKGGAATTSPRRAQDEAAGDVGSTTTRC